MAGPITWQNINGPSLADASHPLQYAAQDFNNSFGVLNDVLKQRQATDDANWQNTKTNNTTDFLNNLYAKYTNADDLKAGIQSGDVAKQLAGYGYQIDANAVRGAADNRLQQLQQQAVQNIAYQHTMTDEANAPTLDALKVAAQQGDKAGIATNLAKLQDAHARNLADAMDYANSKVHEHEQWDQQDQTWKAQLGLTKAQTDALPLQVKAALMSAGAAVTNAQTGQLGQALAQRQFAEQMSDKYMERDAKLRGEAGNLMAYNNPTSADGLKMLGDEIKAQAPDPETAVLWRQASIEAAKQPGATVGSVMQTLMGMDKNRWYKNQLIQISNAGDQGKANASSPANTALVESTNNNLGRVRQQLEDHAAAFKTNQASNWGLPTIPGLTGGKAATVAPSNTVPNPIGLPSNVDIAAAAAKYQNGPKVGLNDTPPAQTSTQPTVGYKPAPASTPIDPTRDPTVLQLHSQLQALQNKAPQNRSVTDRLEMVNLEAKLKDALQVATAKQVQAAQSQAVPPIDPRVVTQAIISASNPNASPMFNWR